ncbi:hypothetical protein D3C78_1328580 [compost metagenome]
MPCRNVNDHLRDEEWIETWSSIAFSKRRYFVKESFQTANSGAPNNSDTIGVKFFKVYSRVYNSLVSCSHSVLNKRIYLTGFLFVHKVFRVEILYLAGELRLEFFGIELCDHGCATHAIDQTIPVIWNGITQRRKCT